MTLENLQKHWLHYKDTGQDQNREDIEACSGFVEPKEEKPVEEVEKKIKFK